MTKATMKIVKGMTAGVATGLLVGYMSKNKSGLTNKRQMKRKADRAIETMSDVVDTVSYMFK